MRSLPESRFLFSHLSGVPEDKCTAMLSDLTFSVERSIDLHVHPLVPLDDTRLALAPPMPLSSRHDEIILRVCSQRSPDIYSIASLEKQRKCSTTCAESAAASQRRAPSSSCGIRSSHGSYAEHYSAASTLNEQLTGKPISRVFGIAKRIWQVDRLMTPAHQDTIREGHAEVCFALMNGCKSLRHHKATAAGRHERRHLLSAVGVPAFDAEEWRSKLPRVTLDDISDAATILWTNSQGCDANSAVAR